MPGRDGDGHRRHRRRRRVRLRTRVGLPGGLAAGATAEVRIADGIPGGAAVRRLAGRPGLGRHLRLVAPPTPQSDRRRPQSRSHQPRVRLPRRPHPPAPSAQRPPRRGDLRHPLRPAHEDPTQPGLGVSLTLPRWNPPPCPEHLSVSVVLSAEPLAGLRNAWIH